MMRYLAITFALIVGLIWLAEYKVEHDPSDMQIEINRLDETLGDGMHGRPNPQMVPEPRG